MRITLSAVAIVLAGSSAAAHGQSNLPINHVRALGMRALDKVRSKFIHGRKMEDATTTADLDEMFADVVAETCQLIETDAYQEEFAETMEYPDVEGFSMACPVFGCDYDPYGEPSNLLLECLVVGPFCIVDEESKEEFCVADIDIKTSMGINVVGDSLLTVTTCAAYTSPDYMAVMGRGCGTINAMADFGDMFYDFYFSEDDPETMIEEEAELITLEDFDVYECSADFDDGTTCECELCNEGTGYHLTCDNDLTSRGCTDFYTNTVTQHPAVSIMELFPEDDAESGILDEDVDKVDTHRTVDQPPCLQEVTLYEYPGEDPTGGTSEYDEDLQQFVMASKPLYTDLVDFETAADDCTALGDGRYLCNSKETTDAVCTALDVSRFLCNIVTTHEVYGSTTAIGIVEFKDRDDLFGTNMFVFTGGTDMYAGIKGKVTNEHKNGVIVHTVCIQAPISIAFSA